MKKVSAIERRRKKGEFNFFVMPKKSLYNIWKYPLIACVENIIKKRYENVANCTKQITLLFY